MRTGRLSISRGHEIGGAPPAPRREPAPLAPVSFSPAANQGELHRVHARLTALERLSRLVEQGALSVEEFKLEKSLVLRLTGEELLLTEVAPAASPAPQPGPSLLGRLRGWRFFVVALAVGFGFSYAAQPDETLAFFSQAAQLVAG
ncbi:MAG TPA: hypothetical protein VGB54_08865 [Allosphingosinicella sp.]|jgi:hypothetical protein